MAVLKSIKPLSLAKIQGLVMFALGIILALLAGILIKLTQELPPNFYLELALTPVSYGIGGFLMGLVTAFLYNKFANKIGGVEFEMKK